MSPEYGEEMTIYIDCIPVLRYDYPDCDDDKQAEFISDQILGEAMELSPTYARAIKGIS